MKNWIKISIVLLVAGAIGAWAGYTFVYNKSHTDFEKAEAAYSLSAQMLYDEFKNDTDGAVAKYTGKVIEIQGILSEVEITESAVVAVFAFEEGMFGAEGIRVTMLPAYNQKLKNHKLSVPIALKGFCPGYNGTDVIFESGSIVK